jgi:hypothetical protein
MNSAGGEHHSACQGARGVGDDAICAGADAHHAQRPGGVEAGAHHRRAQVGRIVVARRQQRAGQGPEAPLRGGRLGGQREDRGRGWAAGSGEVAPRDRHGGGIASATGGQHAPDQA